MCGRSTVRSSAATPTPAATPRQCDPSSRFVSVFFFFNDTATTEIYTLSLHDALPILRRQHGIANRRLRRARAGAAHRGGERSEEHTSELQSHSDLVCRLLLEKKKKKKRTPHTMGRQMRTSRRNSTRTASMPVQPSARD